MSGDEHGELPSADAGSHQPRAASCPSVGAMAPASCSVMMGLETVGMALGALDTGAAAFPLPSRAPITSSGLVLLHKPVQNVLQHH